MHTTSSLRHHQQLELPPCIHQKDGCGAIENSTVPQCPCWTHWEIHKDVQGAVTHGAWPLAAQVCWLIGCLRRQPFRHLRYWLQQWLAVKVHQDWTGARMIMFFATISFFFFANVNFACVAIPLQLKTQLTQDISSSVLWRRHRWSALWRPITHNLA